MSSHSEVFWDESDSNSSKLRLCVVRNSTHFLRAESEVLPLSEKECEEAFAMGRKACCNPIKLSTSQWAQATAFVTSSTSRRSRQAMLISVSPLIVFDVTRIVFPSDECIQVSKGLSKQCHRSSHNEVTDHQMKRLHFMADATERRFFVWSE